MPAAVPKIPGEEKVEDDRDVINIALLPLPCAKSVFVRCDKSIRQMVMIEVFVGVEDANTLFKVLSNTRIAFPMLAYQN